MNNIPQYIINWLKAFDEPDILAIISRSLIFLEKNVSWSDILKASSVILLSLLLANIVFILNERLYDYFSNARIKTHHLTITNNGNTPSIYLLRTLDMPKNIVLRFRIDHQPMIWVTYAPKESLQQDEPQYVRGSDAAEAGSSGSPHDSLIPDLNNPLDPKKKPDAGAVVEQTTKTISKVGKTAGFWASLLSNIATLLPIKIGGLSDAQSSLKNVQQQTTELTTNVNTKVNTVNSLSNQVKQIPGADKVSSMAQSSGMTPDNLKQQAGDLAGSFTNPANSGQDDSIKIIAGEKARGSYLSDDFVYDETVWEKNIGKVDKSKGSLNFAQSKVLEPGESMKIDLEIMNISGNPAAVSHMYKIEIRQIMVSRMNLTAPTQYVNGIVIFRKVNILHRLLPSIISMLLVIIAIQIAAIYSYLIF